MHYVKRTRLAGHERPNDHEHVSQDCVHECGEVMLCLIVRGKSVESFHSHVDCTT
jgi:hypothetical protein